MNQCGCYTTDCKVCLRFATVQTLAAIAGRSRPKGTVTSLPVIRPPCKHEGVILESCKTCGGQSAELRHVRDCELYDTCTRGPSAIRSCSTCSDYAEPPVGFTVDHGASGIGDALLGLMAVAGLKRENPGEHIVYRVSASVQKWLELFDGYDEIGVSAKVHTDRPTPGARQMNLGYSVEWNSKFAAASRLERYCRNIGAVKPHLPSLKEPERIKDLGKDFAGSVVLCPYTTDKTRLWPLDYWVGLERLLIEDGYRTLIVGSERENLIGFAGTPVLGLPPDRVAGIITNARIVIGNDSGMAHLGGILGRPTLVICGDYPGDRIFGCYPKVKCIQG